MSSQQSWVAKLLAGQGRKKDLPPTCKVLALKVDGDPGVRAVQMGFPRTGG